ncbi:SRPBCC family protein [Streptomyces sp. NPDC020141]|uniref:SRPBCC family protein n=1 Tax=Streptomyces sp. NPDC020141 TaxID=3365065 RepID=UPI00378F40F3
MSDLRALTSPEHRGRSPRPAAVRRRTGRLLTLPALALAVAGLLGTSVPAVSAQPQSVRHNGSAECRGEGVDPEALVRHESEIVIDAPLSTVWKLQSDVERWPSWQAPVLTADRLDPGRLEKGSRFRWTTPAPPTPTTPATTLTITSTVGRVESGSCLLWRGPAVGEGVRIDEGVHLWTFEKVRGGVRVHTAETWTGDQVEADVAHSTRLLGEGLEAWLRDLKATAEARTGRS